VIDLHAHSTASDGALAPADLVARAAIRGLELLAITDHDTLAGAEEALAAGAAAGVRVIPGVEISACDSSSVHVLGYFDDSAPEPLRSMLEDLGDHRHARNRRILERLRTLGMPLDYDDVRAIAGAGTVGRPHIARLLVDRGHVADVAEAFDRFLSDRRPAYVPSGALPPREAVELILASGGRAVLAHPLQLRRPDDEIEQLVRELAAAGLTAIEVYRPEHAPRDRARLAGLSLRYDLLASGGSDFHVPDAGLELGRIGRAPDLYDVATVLAGGQRDPRAVGR
jgi:predicted metal-dependent phosphoesterase TrpH